MIPLKLQLHNFMCYRDPSPLDLTGVHLACLAGDNGHGKSALLDAITWALWGKARARYDDELVTLGEREMEVEFEFLLGDEHYRIIRKRELSRQSRGTLEFQIRSEQEYRSLTTSTQRETQARICDLLGMDYETFVNSALLLQGRAAEFTLKTPADRKRVLAEILGLSAYDEYEQRAKDLAKEKEQAAREVEARVQEIERELQRQPDYEQEAATSRMELERLSGMAREAEVRLRNLRESVVALEAQRRECQEVTKRIQTAEAQIQELDAQVVSHDQRIAFLESVLARRATIEEGYTRLLEVRQVESQFGARLPQLLALTEEKADLEKQIAELRKGLELKKAVVEQRASDLRRLSGQLGSLETDHARILQELDGLTTQQATVDSHRLQRAEWIKQISVLETVNKHLKTEMDALKDKMALLQQPTAVCPLCGQDLADGDRERLMAQMEAEGAQKAASFRANMAQAKDLNLQITAIDGEIKRIERELRRLPALQGREAHLAKNVQEAREAAVQEKTQAQELDALKLQLQRGDFAQEGRANLSTLQEQIVALGYDQDAHDEARRAASALAAFEAQKAELDRAAEALTSQRASRQQLAQTRESWAMTQQADKLREAALSAELAGLGEVAREADAVQEKTDNLHNQEGHARQAVGAAQQKLDHCQYLAGERKDRAAQLKRLGEERGLYEELQWAFGKKGLQALIIESAVPEIEEEANHLLARMTEGRMSVHLDTQRDTKGGSTIETLDIKIADENGPRSYEMYSGGEAFRVDLAMRIALSKLLVRRAGTRLQTLIIDEGFGTQDAEGRLRLVEAIHSIQDDFGMVLVITHIDELKDAFPVRIDVVKTAQGSQIIVN